MQDRNYRNQFPKDFHDIPQQILDRVTNGSLVDASWGNNVCPSFATNDEHLTLWVDHTDPKRREFPENKRFWITDTDDELDCRFASDSVEEILTKLDELEEQHIGEEENQFACADCQRSYGPQARFFCSH